MKTWTNAMVAAALGVAAAVFAQSMPTTPSAAPPQPDLTLKLWENAPPNAIPDAKPDRDDGTGRVWDVAVPGMLVYFPKGNKPTDQHPVLMVCPGGSYTHLTHLVGADGAVDAFVPKGFVIISLKYRLKPPSTNVERDALDDIQRAVRMTRYHAKEWGVDTKKIGILGWSAGSNLGLNLATHFDAGNPAAVDPIDRESCRPDFVTLMCTWPDGRDVSAYPVSKDAPPAFFASARDDRTAPTTFTQAVAAAYEKAGASVHTWIIDKGGHGAFTINGPGEGGTWLNQFWPWAKEIGIYP